jgi:sulfur transfer protein SufE
MTDRKPLSDDDIVWTKEAEERLKRAPSFVQPMAKRAILSYARENGIKEITTQVMDVVKEKSGM